MGYKAHFSAKYKISFPVKETLYHTSGFSNMFPPPPQRAKKILSEIISRLNEEYFMNIFKALFFTILFIQTKLWKVPLTNFPKFTLVIRTFSLSLSFSRKDIFHKCFSWKLKDIFPHASNRVQISSVTPVTKLSGTILARTRGFQRGVFLIPPRNLELWCWR